LIHETIDENVTISEMKQDIFAMKQDICILKTDVAHMALSQDEMKDDITKFWMG